MNPPQKALTLKMIKVLPDCNAAYIELLGKFRDRELPGLPENPNNRLLPVVHDCPSRSVITRAAAPITAASAPSSESRISGGSLMVFAAWP